MELFLDIESGSFRNRTGDENMNLCGVRLVRRRDVPVSLCFLGRELEAGLVSLAAYHKESGKLLAYQEGQITNGAVEMVVDFDTQEIREAGKETEGKTIEARVVVLVEPEGGKGGYHSLPLNFYLEVGLIGDEHLPNSARPEWEMMYETVLERAKEAEGFAGAAYASKTAAADSKTAASTAAANAARDAKSANEAKTAVESLAAAWPETVSNGERAISSAKDDALASIQSKQADSVLAVGRAQKTATDKIAGAQADAVSAVQAAGDGAKGTIAPLVQQVETAKEDIDQAEGRINTAATNAATSATNAANSATAAADALEAIPQVDAAGNMTLAGNITAAGGTFDGAINANGGVRVPEPSTAQEALSYDSLLEQQARREWNLVKKASYAAVPCWVSTLVNMQTVGSYRHHTPNASIQQGVILNNDLYDHLVQMTPASGVSLLGLGTPSWRFSELLGDYRSAEFAAASAWGISGGDDVSLMLGSPTQGYSATTDVSAPCYAHPIHWVNFNRDGMDYRYPLLNTVNHYTGRDMTPAWQVTTYGRSYLGSTASCLIRGTDYGRDVGDQQYIWGLVPGMTYLAVAMAPRQPGDHGYVQNRWELFVDGNHVMPMTSLFCGTGHTACVTATVKAHEVGRTLRTGLRMAGMRVDTGQMPGSAAAREILGAVVMDGATVKPVPEVEASALEVPTEGGDVRLTASSALSEALYVLNDTMNGHDPAAVWCTQDSEEIPAGGGQVTLTLAANTTGQPREVWAFVGHHYAQAAVIKINQLA